MGVCAVPPVARPLSDVPLLQRRARDRWLEDKDFAATATADLLLTRSRMPVLAAQLYALLGGTEKLSSPITLKGGAAFVVYMSREVAFHSDTLPSCLHTYADAADLDFASNTPASQLVVEISSILPWFAETSTHIWTQLQKKCPQWRLRRDGNYGEIFFGGRSYKLGSHPDIYNSMDLPIKLSYHGGLVEKHTGKAFDLVRIGAAVWHIRLRRAAVAAFVDISLTNMTIPTVCVMGMRVQAPRSMLKALRRMTFHETAYAPWHAAYGDAEKQDRRFQRLVLLSFFEDWKTMRGSRRGPDAKEGLQHRWMKALDFMLTGHSVDLRRLASSAPPQMCFLFLCCARTAEKAPTMDMLEEYNAWVENSVIPIVVDLCE